MSVWRDAAGRLVAPRGRGPVLVPRRQLSHLHAALRHGRHPRARPRRGFPPDFGTRAISCLVCACPTVSMEVAAAVSDDFITDCVVESQERTPEGWLIRLEPITASAGGARTVHLPAYRIADRARGPATMDHALADQQPAGRRFLSAPAAGAACRWGATASSGPPDPGSHGSVAPGPEAGRSKTGAAQQPQTAPDLWAELRRCNRARGASGLSTTAFMRTPVWLPFSRCDQRAAGRQANTLSRTTK